MSATVIQFPTQRSPAHWTGADVYRFEHHRDSGMSIKQATDAVEQYRHTMRQEPGESEIDALRRQAREAFVLMARA